VASITRGPVCGDAQVGFSEECDDGNLVGGDGCSAQCEVEPGFSCTSIVIEGGLVFSICSANPAGCGDAVRDESEQCDDGDLASGDGCSATCTIEEGFACVGAVGQLSLCTSPGCGDGVLAEDEACDDGNVAGGDGCGTTCEVEPGWICDAVFIPCGYDGCTALRVSVCARSEGCGDRRHVAGEQCDDGNVSDGDGCSASCLLEDGFTCFDVVSTAPQDAPPSYTRCEPRGCGDGAINEGEACDDWNLEDADGCSSGCSLEPGYTCGVSTVTALPEVLVHRTVDCVSLACGDGALDPGEVCDDGAGNGQAGFCSTDCRDRLPLALVETDPYALVPRSDMVGIIGSITLPDVLCVDAPPDPGVYQDRLRFLDDNGFLVGRLMVAREAFRVESPLLLFDDGLAPFDGRAALGMRTSMADAVFGTVEIGAGEMFVAPVAGAPTLGQCDWCGIGGFSQQQDFCFGEDGSPIGPGPGPCPPQGMTCPETRFRPERSIELAAPDFPADPLDGPGPVTLSCDRSCLIAGGLELCTEPSGGGPELPGGLECIADSIVDLRLCEQLGEGPFGGGIKNCPGGCEGRTDGPCTLLGAGDESDLDLGCMFAACAELGLGRCCSPSDVPDFDWITDLDPDMAWMMCRRDPDREPCDLLRLPPSLVPPEVSFDTILQCSPGLLPRSGEQRCRLCGEGLGNKCVVGSVPKGLVRAVFPRADFAPRPAEGDGVEELERLANSELRSRLGADPRRMDVELDPVALLTGEMVFEATDVAFPSRGVPLTFTRAYRSGALRSGALGPGFSHGYEERIEVVADPDNTRGAAGFCTRALHDDDNATCLLHHDGHGGTTLFAYDAASGNYLPAPGGRGVVHVSVPEDPIPRSVAAQGAGVPTYFLTEPVGITRTFDISGVLLSVKDEMGFGVELKYQLRSPKDVVIGGAWSGALPSGLIPLSERSLAAGFTRHVNRLNQMVLVGIEDSYGRELELGYRTYFDSDEDKSAGLERRQRLHTLAYVDRESGERHVLVEYDYVTVPETNDAYLSRVTRYGLADGLAAAEPIVMEYEYAHDLLAPGGALAFSLSDNGDVLPDSELGIAVDAALLDYASRLVACQRGLVFPAADIDNACGQPAILEGATGIGVAGTASLWRILQQHVADNIVRIRRAGEIEIETRYGANPLLPAFDRAMEQRYGALPAPRAAPRPVREAGYGGTIVHRWLTDMPSTHLMDVDEESLDERVKAAVPLAEHVPVEDDGSSAPGICQSLNADALPLFRLHDPAGPRTDWRTRSLARTTYNCAAIAGRHARDLYAHDLIELPGTDDQAGTRREQLAADLNLACRFVEVKDRAGASRVYGLNYQGIVLVEAGPSPSGGGLAITRRRVNADGNVVEEIRPDCSSTEVVWAADDDDDDQLVGVDSGDGPNLDAGLALVRDEVASITERAPQDLVRANDPVCSGYAVHLEPPVVEDEHGVARVAADRRWVFAYEPLYQQMVSATGPDSVTTLRRYDYQQLPANSRLADELVARAAVRTGATVSAEVFVGADYDGDGSLAETSAGIVLLAVRGVDLGGGRRGDVGTRWQRNHSGRVVRESTIADVGDAGA
ncbi:MAG TPA: DUF4215 domain-containing protein, partial [Thermoleophilia bacterium]|nr:DUF4215 domain-containing protein [Thermoleophilia bacterium]